MSVRALSVLAAAAGLLGGCASHSQPSDAGVSLAALPSIQRVEYRVDPYIQAAGQLQSTGKGAAFQQLLTLARSEQAPDDFENRLKVAVLCRMLFSKRPGSNFTRPGLGAPAFLEGYTGVTAHSFDDPRFKKWPLEPIEIVEGVPFAIVGGYSYQGFWDPHGTESYVRYCMTNCEWSSTRFTPRSRREKEAALQKLLSSPNWGDQLGNWASDYLRSQIK